MEPLQQLHRRYRKNTAAPPTYSVFEKALRGAGLHIERRRLDDLIEIKSVRFLQAASVPPL